MNFDFETYMKKMNYKKYDKKVSKLEKRLRESKLNGWYDIDSIISKEEVNTIKELGDTIRKNCDVFIIVGIGGSYLGSKMIDDSLSKYLTKKKVEIIYLGTSLSSEYLKSVIDYIKDKEVYVNLITKSGTTLEPMITFNYLIKCLENKYTSEELSKRIIVTTEKSNSLYEEALYKKYNVLTIPKNIGGRYSVLTSVGLLPSVVEGYNIDDLLKGAKAVKKEDVYKYIIIRDTLYKSGKKIESFTFYEEKLLSFGEWLKQLFAESQGKNNKGILPITTFNTRDLHSLGQYYQEGESIIFETVINYKNYDNIVTDYNVSLEDIKNIAINAVATSHYENNIYSSIISINKLDEYSLGYLIYYFELAAAYGGFLLEVNPFNQDGVQLYKKNIKEKLNKLEG